MIKIQKFVTVINFLIIAGIIFVFQNYNVVSGDDIWTPFLTEHPNHGRYFAFFLTKMFVHILPAALHIHPNSLANTIVAGIKGIDVAILCFIIAFFAYLNREKTYITSILPFFIFLFYINLISRYSIEELNQMTFHFGYITGELFYFLFLLIIGKLLLNNKAISKPQLFCYSILGGISGCNDTFAVAGICTLIFLYITLIVVFIKENGAKNFIKKFFTTYKNIIIISLVFVLSAITAIKGMLQDAHIAAYIDKNFTINLNNFILFLKEYIKSVLFSQPVLITIIGILTALILVNKNHNKMLMIFSISALAGVLAFFFSLIIGGTGTFYISGKFWICHNDLQIFLTLNFLTVILALYGHYYEISKGIVKNILITAGIIFTAFPILYVKDCINFYLPRYQLQKNEKKLMYQAEKMYLFYAYKNKTAILPISLLSSPDIGSSFWIGINNSHLQKLIDEFERNRGNKDWREYIETIEQIKKIKFVKTHFRETFVKHTYNITDSQLPPYSFMEDQQAFEKYYSEGGFFKEDELATTPFNKLLDKKFFK